MQFAVILVASLVLLPQLSQIQAVKPEDFTPPGMAKKEITVSKDADQNISQNIKIEGTESEKIKILPDNAADRAVNNQQKVIRPPDNLSGEPTTLKLMDQQVAEDGTDLNRANNPRQINQQLVKERIQIRKELMEQEQASKSASRSASRSANRSVTAQEHMSIVAQHVQRLLAVPDRDGGIGAEIREIARQQKTTQASIAGELRQVQNQNRWLRWLIGPSKSNLDKLVDQQEQIEKRIARLQELQLETVDEAIQQTLEEAMIALEEQQLLLDQEIETETNRFSLLSWALNTFSF